MAAHSFGVAVVAMLLADECRARGVELNVERVVRLALLHDLAESRTGDMPRTMALYYGAEARRRAEGAAFADLIAGLGEEQKEEYEKLHAEYEERASVEARLVKAADVVDLLAQALAFERAGARELDEFWEGAQGREFGLEGAAREVVRETIGALVAARAELPRG